MASNPGSPQWYSAMDQAGTVLADFYAVSVFRMFNKMVESGMSRPEALDIAKSYLTAHVMGDKQNKGSDDAGRD